tara:strand:- start:369 stop:1166 length:798 start_codon:yes stop_codon:yes gene_type:complete
MANVNHTDPSEAETKELTYPVHSTLDDVGVDSSTDPDNSQIASPNKNYRLPNWLANDWQLNDNLDSLVPTATYLALVQEEARLDKFTDLSRKGMRDAALSEYGAVRVEKTKGSDGKTTEIKHPSMIDTLVTHYKEIIDNLTSQEQFPVVSSIGQMVTQFLADRAVQAVRIDTTDLSGHDEIPEWFTATLDKKYNASAQAGKWMEVHKQIWTYVGYNNDPKYFSNYAVSSRLRNLGKYMFTQHVYSDMQKATVADIKQFVDAKYQC